MKASAHLPYLARCALLGLALLLLCSCSRAAEGIKDGYYMAQAADFDTFGWKEYVTLCVRDGRILTVEYDAKNASGFIKSWDMEYMRAMDAVDGTYPNEYTRAYAESLLSKQTPEDVSAVTGATASHQTFQILTRAALEQAQRGEKSIALVPISPYGETHN